MAYSEADGSSFVISVDILDEDDNPVIPAPGWPKAQLLDLDKVVISEYSMFPGQTQGSWDANIVLPEIGVTQPTDYRVRFRCKDIDGEKYSVFETITITPKADRRASEIVLMPDDVEAEFVLPIKYQSSYGAQYQLYKNNAPLLGSPVLFSSQFVQLDVGSDRTVVKIPAISVMPSLDANLLTVRATIKQRPTTYNFRYWCITPQIAVAATMLESFLNKSRIENIIPELEYTYGDLLGYLERGLYLFNMTGAVTSFNGLNMQGVLLDAWSICSSYWAISTQLIAEGSLAFDFSGQGISLNVDRTPQLDSALGRIEARIQDTVLPLKKQLASQGIIRGDGSIGKTSLRDPYSGGLLAVTRSPTTRLGGLR